MFKCVVPTQKFLKVKKEDVEELSFLSVIEKESSDALSIKDDKASS